MNAAILKITQNQAKRLSDNLTRILAERDLSESVIASALNIPVMTVRRVVSGETIDPRISTLKLLADYLNVSIDSLMEDDDQKSIEHLEKSQPIFVPILDWKIIKSIKSIKDLDLKLWKEWQPVVLGSSCAISGDAFAIFTKPSMQPRFPIGTLLVIDPEEEPIDGDIVLIQTSKNGDLSLRGLVIDSPRWQLQPITPGSEMLFYEEKQTRIIGVVVLTMLHARKNI